jgi:hypothetical protein
MRADNVIREAEDVYRGEPALKGIADPVRLFAVRASAL